MIFDKFYPRPFTNTFSKVFTKEHGMAFDFPMSMIYPKSYQFSEEEKQHIIDCLNGDSNKRLDIEQGFLKYIPENTTIYLFADKVATPFIIVRGWGNLTGTGGGHGLPPEEASKIQDEFAQWIIDTLIKEK